MRAPVEESERTVGPLYYADAVPVLARGANDATDGTV